MNPRIVAVSGPLKGTVFAITDTGLVIGRKHPDNNVILEHDDMVSRRHCRLEYKDGHVVVRDLESRNGTFINGVSVLEKVLTHGDRLKVGSSTFIYSEQEQAEDAIPVFIEADRDGTRKMTTFRLDREQAEAAASDKAILRAMIGIASSINAIRDTDRLQERLLELIFEILPAQRAAILIVGHKPGTFVSGVWRERGIVGGSKFPIIEEVSQTALKESDVVSRGDVLCIPLTVGKGNFGVIYLQGTDADASFDHEHVQLLTAVTGIASVALEHARYVDWLQTENERLKEEVDIEHGMIGEDPKMTPVFNAIRKVAPSDGRVLITGETGTGKELAARAIHQNSPRSKAPFIGVNCAAIPESMRESELFGHEKGSFTGATGQHKGKIEQADGGTLFLDEVGELSLAAQASLLRVLELGELYRVGSTRPINVDVRVIAATNRDLNEAVKKGQFREDLLYRLNVVAIRMPALRESPADIAILASYFLKKFARNRIVLGFSPEVHQLFLQHHWPGNIRELRNTIERAVLMGASEYILAEDLPESLLEGCAADKVPTRGLRKEATELRNKAVQTALLQTGFDKDKAATTLGITVGYLNKLIRDLGIVIPAKAKSTS